MPTVSISYDYRGAPFVRVAGSESVDTESLSYDLRGSPFVAVPQIYTPPVPPSPEPPKTYICPEEQDPFYEGPKAIVPEPTKSGIDTRLIDAFRQGVEITQQRHFDAGIVKIHAGEPGHVKRQTEFGMRHTNLTCGRAFLDNDRFVAENFIEAQDGSLSLDETFTFPIVVSGDGEVETENFDGVIEPLTIRKTVSRSSIDIPFDSHDIKGALMEGSADCTTASSQILQVDYFDGQQEYSEYDDRGYFKPGIKIKNFDDSLSDIDTVPHTMKPAQIVSFPGTYPASITAGQTLTFGVGSLRSDNSDFDLHDWNITIVTFAGTEQTIDDVINAINSAAGYDAASVCGETSIKLVSPKSGWNTFIYVDSTNVDDIGFKELAIPSLRLDFLTFGEGKWDSTMAAAILSLSDSTDNYISIKQRSSSAGWDYDNNAAVGTDSIAFGGMTY